MPEEIEIETKELQEAIQEMHAERDEHHREEKQNAWTKYVALSTAILAVFAAVGAMQSGALVNEAMMKQLRASDTWNEYQGSKVKFHLYKLRVDEIAPGSPHQAEYTKEVAKQTEKSGDLSKEAKKLEHESEELMHKHHKFAYAVALVQVSIALGAVAAIARQKLVWLASILIGLASMYFFLSGFLS